ncbi:hypothetical protein M569_10490, partial [Genlisea aurea]
VSAATPSPSSSVSSSSPAPSSITPATTGRQNVAPDPPTAPAPVSFLPPPPPPPSSSPPASAPAAPNAAPPPAPVANAPAPSTPSKSSTPPPLPPPPPPPPPPPSVAPEPSPPPPSRSSSSPPSPPNSPPPPEISPPPPSSSPPPPLQTSPLPALSPPPPPPSPPPPSPFVPPSIPSPPAVPSPFSPVSPPSSSNASSKSPIIFPSPPSATSVVPSLSPPPNQDTVTSSGTSGGGQGFGTVGEVGLSVAFGIFSLGLFGAVVFCALNRRKKKGRGRINGHQHSMPTSLSYRPSGTGILKMQVAAAPNDGSGSSNNLTHSPRDLGDLRDSRSWFTYEDLVKATDGFSSHNLLGEGGFGSVYKGTLADGRVVAVKKLKIVRGDGDREFRSEVEIISRIHHRHLVSLVGHCIYEERRLLVYDYLPNDTLYFHLHGEGRPALDWAQRIKIAIGAARGIAYLHEDCHPRIIHRDIKSSNILLDNNFEARVSDFGLAKLAMDANSHVTTRVMGTFGYMAPEYASSGKLTEKSDVYSFGVVLLELISGRKSVDMSQPLGDESLVEWARPLLSRALEFEEFGGLPDPKLEGNYVTDEMFRLIEAAAACVRHSSARRPTMGQIVRAFDGMAYSDLNNGMRVGDSEVFNSALQSAQIRFFRRLAFGSPEFSTQFFSQNS